MFTYLHHLSDLILQDFHLLLMFLLHSRLIQADFVKHLLYKSVRDKEFNFGLVRLRILMVLFSTLEQRLAIAVIF